MLYCILASTVANRTQVKGWAPSRPACDSRVAVEDTWQAVQEGEQPEELVQRRHDDVHVHEAGDERLGAAVGRVVQQLGVLQCGRRCGLRGVG